MKVLQLIVSGNGVEAASFSPDLYIGTALSGLVELPAILLEYAVIESYGRRPALAGFLLLAGLPGRLPRPCPHRPTRPARKVQHRRRL